MTKDFPTWDDVPEEDEEDEEGDGIFDEENEDVDNLEDDLEQIIRDEYSNPD